MPRSSRNNFVSHTLYEVIRYLRKVVSDNLRREAAQAERKQEDQRAGRTQTGGLPPPPPPPAAAAPKPAATYTRPPIELLRGAIGQHLPKVEKQDDQQDHS